jgi:hypothetical protein
MLDVTAGTVWVLVLAAVFGAVGGAGHQVLQAVVRVSLPDQPGPVRLSAGLGGPRTVPSSTLAVEEVRVAGNKGREDSRRALGALAAATFFLFLGLGVVWFARKVAQVEDGAVLASFVIVPALLYVVLRGDLAELKGPGGWVASFVRVARTEVSATGNTLVTSEDVQIIEKKTFEELATQAPRLKSDQPVLMTMALANAYTAADVLGYLETLSRFPRFRLVALVDGSGKFLGCMSPPELTGIMRSALGPSFLEAIKDGDMQEVFRYPGTLREVMLTTETNTEALSRMTSLKLDSVAIVDERHQLLGVVEREQLVSKLILSLCGSS